MSDAYQCDACGTFETGRHAPLYLDIEEMARSNGTGDVHFEDGSTASWARTATDAEFCGRCAASLLDHVNAFIETGGADE